MTLPDATRLVHIGPHKTGTTSLQAALWSARPALLRQGVRHVGRSQNPSVAVRAVVHQPSPYSADRPPAISNWKALVREIEAAREPRVIVSSEFFAWAAPNAIRRIVSDLDPARVHVAVTLRPLARVIPSMWQQNIQLGTVTPLEAWVHEILDDPTKPFWQLQRHDELIRRWVDVVGPERLTVVVVDDRDHHVVMRAFEGLLGLEPGTLRSVRGQMNRSLSMPEAEAIRAFNVAFAAEKLPRDLHARVMRFGAAQVMKRRPASHEAPVVLPPWAYEPVAAIQEEMVGAIRSMPIAVIGDLAVLTRDGAPPVEPGAPREPGATPGGEAGGEIPADVVGAMGVALLESTGALRTAPISKGPFTFAEPAEVLRVPTYQLLGTVAGRLWRASVGRLPGLGRRSRRRRTEPGADEE